MSVQERRGNVPLPRVLCWFWALSVAAFLVTPIVAYLEYRAGMTREYWDPIQHPFFADLLEYIPTFQLLHTNSFFGDPHVSAFAYPPFAAVLFVMMYGTGHPVELFVVIAAVSLVSMVIWVRRGFIKAGISSGTATALPVSLVICSFPLARLLPQGNIELILWIFLLVGIWLYVRGNAVGAAVFWGLAAAIKLYPLAMLLMFFRRWRRGPFFLGLLVFAGSTWLSLLYMGPSVHIALDGSIRNVFGYQTLRVGQWTMNIVATNHSLFTLVKFAAAITGTSFNKLTLPYYLCGSIFFVTIYFLRLRKMPFANQLFALSLIMVMLPTVSYFHTLVHLYAPWMVLALLAIRAERAGVRIAGLSTTILLLFPLFVSFTLYTFRAVFLFAGFIQAILLCFLMLYTLQYRFELPDASGQMEENGARA